MPRQHLLEIESPFLEQVAFPSFCFCCVTSGMTMGTGRIMLGNPWPGKRVLAVTFVDPSPLSDVLVMNFPTDAFCCV